MQGLSNKDTFENLDVLPGQDPPTASTAPTYRPRLQGLPYQNCDAPGPSAGPALAALVREVASGLNARGRLNSSLKCVAVFTETESTRFTTWR